MREIPYKDFSLITHRKNWLKGRPNLCQFELTFGCGLRCQYCCTGCYNDKTYIKKELSTEDVKRILDKIYDFGIIWLCFSGGDPLTRKGFLDIYSYAKEKGFIIIIFTNAYSMTREIAAYLKSSPPFVIEITLNAVEEDSYEKISQVKGSFSKTMKGIDMILGARLPLKIKTQVAKDNLEELPAIKNYVEGLGLKFRRNAFLNAGLNGDPAPYNSRISPEEVLGLSGIKSPLLDDCKESSYHVSRNGYQALFSCAITGGDGVIIDPYGNTFPCNCIREPKVNLLKTDIEKARCKILDWVRTKNLAGDSKCRVCPIRRLCYNCPGKALLEKGSLSEVVDWHCELAHLKSRTLVRV